MGAGFTSRLAERLTQVELGEIPADVVEIARHCLLDWLGVTLAGSVEPASRIALAVAREDELGDHGATVVGTAFRLSPANAALVNGTASHALDYDDANTAMLGHPTAPVMSALLPLAEVRRASGREVLAAFVVGYEAECQLARAIGPSHYRAGYHATGTVGTIGAAAACARLMRVDSATVATAIGLAATQAAGLKCMFGTMAKPLHAGKAATNGLLAARLAAAGFTAHSAAIEAEQGFASTMSGGLDPRREAPSDEWHVRGTLFKYHAACFETHSTIEGIRDLLDAHCFGADEIDRVVIHANRLQLGMCAIAEPLTGLEVKFSLRHLAAAAVCGVDTSAVDSFDLAAVDPQVLALRDRVVVADDGPSCGGTPVEVVLSDGRRLVRSHDTHIAATDLDAQRRRLTTKARALAELVLGDGVAGDLVDTALSITDLDDVADLLALTRTESAHASAVGSRLRTTDESSG